MRAPEPGMATYRIEVGHYHGVKPGNIVGAIANEGGIAARDIGRIEIYDDFSTLDMPADLPQDLVDHLKKVWVAGQQLGITHKFTRAYRPQTNGKAERFIQSALREWAYGWTYQNSEQRRQALHSWQHHYNWHRPHHGIGRVAPMS